MPVLLRSSTRHSTLLLLPKLFFTQKARNGAGPTNHFSESHVHGKRASVGHCTQMGLKLGIAVPHKQLVKDAVNQDRKNQRSIETARFRLSCTSSFSHYHGKKFNTWNPLSTKGGWK